MINTNFSITRQLGGFFYGKGSDNMRNGAEALSLSNRTFPDLTAWKGIKNADRRAFGRPKQVEYPQKSIITDLHQELASLSIQRQNGEISRKDYREKQQKTARLLQEEEIKRGNKPKVKKTANLL